MKINLQKRRYESGLKKEIQLYRDTDSFIRHLYKHTFDKQEVEVWKRLLPLKKSHWQALARRKHIQNHGAALMLDNTIQDTTLQDCYDELASLLDRGISYADRTPLFARFEELCERPRMGYRAIRISYHLLSEHGMIIKIQHDVVRTAFFSLPRGNSTSFYDLFWSGMQNLLHEVLRVRSGKYWYHPETGMRIHGLDVEQVRPENFSNRINPWPATKTVLKNRKGLKRTEIEKIAQKYFQAG